MTRQVIVLSVVLLVSVIINVWFIFDKAMGPEEPKADTSSENLQIQTQQDSELTAKQKENILYAFQGFVTQLKSLKMTAQRENASNTVRAIDEMIRLGQSQIAVYSTENALK